MASALLLVAQYAFFTGITILAQAESDPSTDSENLWIDVSIGADFVDWINATARDDDIVRIDHLPMMSLLDDIQRGQKLVVVKTIPEAGQVLAQAADQIDIIGYNLEHGPANDPSEQAAPVESVQHMRNLADEYGVRLAIGPDRSFALSDGLAMAEHADIMILQVQRVQQDSQTVMDFVLPLVTTMRERNPDVQVGVQIGAQGDVEQLVALIRLLATNIDGVSILTDHDSVDFSAQLVQALRPASSDLTTPTAESETNESFLPKATKTTLTVSTPTPEALRSVSTPKPTLGASEGPNTAATTLFWLGSLIVVVFGVGIAITAFLYAFPNLR